MSQRIRTLERKRGEQLLRIIETFEARHPQCEVQLSATSPADQGDVCLTRGETDRLATPLLLDPAPGYVVVATLDTEPRVVAVASDHPLAHRALIEVEDLGDDEVVAPHRVRPADRAACGQEGPAGRGG